MQTEPKARSRQARDETGADRIRCSRKDNRYYRCGLLCGEDCASRRDNDIDFESDELGRDLGVTLASALRPANLEDDVPTFDPAQFAKSLLKPDD